MTLHILSNKEKQEITEKLNQQFGISEFPGLIIKLGEEKLFLFQGSFDEKQIKQLAENIPVERIGIYLAKIQGHEIRLSIDGVNLLKNQITKNIFEMPSEYVEQWMKGQELDIKPNKKGFVIMKHGNDFLGTGKASENKITNFIPKNRRLKKAS